MKTPILRIQKFIRTFISTPKPKRMYFFRVLAANSKIVCQSEMYTTARARNQTVSLLVRAKMEEEK